MHDKLDGTVIKQYPMFEYWMALASAIRARRRHWDKRWNGAMQINNT